MNLKDLRKEFKPSPPVWWASRTPVERVLAVNLLIETGVHPLTVFGQSEDYWRGFEAAVSLVANLPRKALKQDVVTLLQKGIKPALVAKKLGLSESYVYRLERGRKARK